MTIDLKHQIRTYWHERADAFDDIASHRRDADIWDDVLTRAVRGIPKMARVLDLGAGTGACALPMARLGHRVTAVDLAPAMLDRLQDHARAEGLDIETCRSDVDDLAMPDRSFDLVTMRNLLWTLPDPKRLLQRIRRALRPGGVMLIADGFWDHDVSESRPDDAHWSHNRFIELYRPIAADLPFYRGVSTATVERLVTAAGFSSFRHWSDDFERSPYLGVTDDFFVLTASADAVDADDHALG